MNNIPYIFCSLLWLLLVEASYVRPIFSFDDAENCCCADLELLGQEFAAPASKLALLVVGEDEADFRLGQLVARLLAPRLPALFDLVVDVVKNRSDEQMLWVDAQDVVAAVANQKIGRRFPEMDIPRKSVGVDDSQLLDLTISSTSGWSCPNPALPAVRMNRSIFIDLTPEISYGVCNVMCSDLPTVPSPSIVVLMAPTPHKSKIAAAFGGTSNRNGRHDAAPLVALKEEPWQAGEVPAFRTVALATNPIIAERTGK